jgi:hypothetical protein
MNKQLSTILFLITTVAGGVFSTASLTSAQSVGNTINNTSVVNTLGTGTAVNNNRTSRSEIRNPGGANVHNDIQIGAQDSCGQSTVNNDVSHQGSTGAQVSVNVDVCNPAAGAQGGRRNIRR